MGSLLFLLMQLGFEARRGSSAFDWSDGSFLDLFAKAATLFLWEL